LLQAVKLFSTLTARCLSIQSSTQTCSVQCGEESSELSNTTRCLSLSIQCSNEHSLVTSDEESSEASFGDLVGDGYTSVFDNDHFVLPRRRSMLCRSTSPTGCCDAVFITEADLEGYETYADTTCDDAISVDIVVRHKPIMRRLSCFLGSLKITGNCEPPPSRLTEVRAC
jgi:atypical dual specificity phosphatase